MSSITEVASAHANSEKTLTAGHGDSNTTTSFTKYVNLIANILLDDSGDSPISRNEPQSIALQQSDKGTRDIGSQMPDDAFHRLPATCTCCNTEPS